MAMIMLKKQMQSVIVTFLRKDMSKKVTITDSRPTELIQNTNRNTIARTQLK